jgi:2-iminobutanoate/2-iminopropanoate deaminase
VSDLAIGRISPDSESSSLSAHSTWFNGIVSTTQIPRRDDGSFELGDIRAQSEVTLSNLRRDLEAAGSSMANILQLTIYLFEIDEWAAFNEVYVQYVPKPYPSRCAIGIAALAVPGMRVEVTALAARL